MAETQQGQEEKQKREQDINFPLSGLGRSGTRATGQAGKLIAQAGTRAGSALLTTPTGWVIIGITIVIVFTLVVMFSFSPSPSPSPSSIEAIIPTARPTQTIMPTPAP